MATFDCQPDDALRAAATNLRYQVQAGKKLDPLLPQAFGLAAQVLYLAYGIHVYEVQLRGAIWLCGRNLVEMVTGEGKTIAALLPLFLRALPGEGVLLATANDYLAARAFFERLGMTVGCVTDQSEDRQRREAYRCDVTLWNRFPVRI